MTTKYFYRLLILVFSLGMISSCSNPLDSSSTATLLLDCTENCNTKVVLSRLDTSVTVVLDSLKLKPGKTVQFRFHPEETGFYLLTWKPNQRHLIVVHPGDSIKVTLLPDDKAIFKGGKENSSWQNFTRQMENTQTKIDSLLKSLETVRYTGDYGRALQTFDSAVPTWIRQNKTEAESFLRKHPDYLSQVLVINAMMGQQALFRGMADSSLYFYTDSTLAAHYENNAHRLMHHHRVQKLRQLARIEAMAMTQLKPGNPVPDITLPDFSDKPYPLLKMKGTPTLLYFWAPQDALSRQANQKLKLFTEKKTGKDYRVYAVAFDPLVERWKAAVNLDKLWWTNVIDTLGDQSPLREKFIIERLPVLVYLDKDNRIVQRFTSVDAFEDFIQNK